MTKSIHPIEGLQEIVSSYRHMRGEHGREGEQGSWRRNLIAQMEELEQKFETLLSRWVLDEKDRSSWRNCLHHGDPTPEDNLERVPPMFLGRSEMGSVVELRESPQGEYAVIVDGSLRQRSSSRLTFGDSRPVLVNFADQKWTEISRVDESALEGLQGYVASPAGEPPWQLARMLFSDGLIDANFSLTPRGKRILNQRAMEKEGLFPSEVTF